MWQLHIIVSLILIIRICLRDFDKQRKIIWHILLQFSMVPTEEKHTSQHVSVD